MTILKFSDGVEIDTAGPLRVYEGPDGLYVVGEGMLCACGDREEAAQLMRDLRERLDKKGGS